MKLIPLKTVEEQNAHGGASHVAILTHADLTEETANTAQAIAIADVNDKVSVEVVETILKTPFQDASDAAFNTTALEVGDGSDVDRLLVSQELNVNGTEVDRKEGTGTYQYTASDTVDANFNAMSAKALNDIDTGEVHIYLRVIDHRNPNQ